MKMWKRNVIVAAVLAVVCAGIYLNWRFEENQKIDLTETLDREKILNDTTFVVQAEGGEVEALANQDPAARMADYFAKMRLSRQESRDNAVHLLQETIAYAGEHEDVSDSTNQLQGIVNTALSEASIESLVVAKGYADCVAYMTKDGITLAVAAGSGLQETDVAVLTDIVLTQTDFSLPQIRIVEVNDAEPEN